jgi:V8-like Glu-specific endopeptidase
MEGFLFSHSGNVAETKKTSQDGVVIHYNADATPGNSGSALYTTSRDIVNQLKYHVPETERVLVGVHNGWDKDTNSNFGTVIT